MLQYLRERLTLVLIGLLPFHALLVTVFTRVLSGPGHAPLGTLVLWKESLLGLILLIAVVEIFNRSRQAKIENQQSPFALDSIDGLILALMALSIVVFANTGKRLDLFLFGFKYDFVPLEAFLLLRRVSWSDAWKKQVMQLLLMVAVLIGFYGIATLFFPNSFFTSLGYAPAHSLYFSDGSLAAFQKIGESGMNRIQSTMSGPNQLAMWLLIPLSVLLTALFSSRGDYRLQTTDNRRWMWLWLCVVLGALFLSYSRAAWIGAAVMGGVVAWTSLQGNPLRNRYAMMAAGVLSIGIALAVMLFPTVLLRLGSTRAHFDRPIEAVHRMIAHPFGMGLGMAGPASSKVSDACVFLRPQDDPAWARTLPRLCVYLGEKQVQPTDRTCECPFYPENWYLQMGVELGWLGLALFVGLIGMILVRLRRLQSTDGRLQMASFLCFLGIAVGALFLHAWEDAAVAYTAWILAGSVLAKRQQTTD